MTQIYDIGRSALSSYQQALTTVSRNVANANTPGYARQSVSFREQAGGAGVDAVTLNRAADTTAQAAARDAVDERSFAETRANVLSRIDNLLSNDATGLAEPLQRLSTSVGDFAAQPTDLAVRRTVLARAEEFSGQVQNLNSALASESRQATQTLSALVNQAQDKLDQLAGLQNQIDRSDVVDAATATLMDQRDVLLEDLAGSVGIKSQINLDGSLQVTLGNGQPAIEAGEAVRLGLGTGPDGEVQLTTNGNLQPTRVVGGEAAAYLQLVNIDIPSAQDELGRIAQGVAAQFNAAQAAGEDLNGNTGAALFTEAEPVIRERSTNNGAATLSATIADSAQLPPSRFTLSFDGASWSATSADGVNLPLTGSGTTADPFQVGGLSVEVSGAAANGDAFVIQPAPASGVSAETRSADQLAAAAPGSGADSGDNSNALALQSALGAGYFDGGRTAVQDANVNFVSSTGQVTATALSNADIARAAENFALDRRDSIQGVNLDEEAADLLRYQQAYAAAAQVLSTASSLFDSVLAAVRS